MQIQIKVTKRSGELEDLDLDKIHKVLQWATEGVENVSASEIEIKSKLQFCHKIKTENIHQILIKTAGDLISLKYPNYQVVASRLLLFDLRKKVWGGSTPPKLKDFVVKMVESNRYDKDVLDKYSDADFEYLDSIIDHNKDYNFMHSGLQQLVDKYLLIDRTTGMNFETPQFLYMLVAMFGFINENENRLEYISNFYTYISDFKINLPTPILANLRTSEKQFASCVLLAVDDNLKSISQSNAAIMEYASLKSGLGIQPTIRPIGASVRNGAVVHTGCIPYYRTFESSLKSTSQGGLRGASATLYFPWWHYEVMDLLMLKDNSGTEDTRIRHLDYAICFDDTFYKALENKEDVYLIDSSKTDIYEHFGLPTFKSTYDKLVHDSSVRKTKISALEIFERTIIQRLQTGRIYILNIDEVNRHSSFTELVRGSNLCGEICAVTKPFKTLDDPDGEISLCTLLALNVGLIKEREYKPISYIACRFLDNILDYQEYPFEVAGTKAKQRRNIGIGITNLAYYFAKHKVNYRSEDALDLTHKLAETLQYNLMLASTELAEERGKCEFYNLTKYSQGFLPIDTYNKKVDTLGNFEYHHDWNYLREQIKLNGTRFSTHTALMPCESSSVVTNSTNGIEPIRDYLISKKSKGGVLKTIVPEFSKLASSYDVVWNTDWDNISYLKIVAIFQKFLDQSISANTYYSNKKYPENKVPLSVIAREIIFAKNHGVKTLYYSNTDDGTESDIGCEGSCAV